MSKNKTLKKYCFPIKNNNVKTGKTIKLPLCRMVKTKKSVIEKRIRFLFLCKYFPLLKKI